MPHSPVFGPKFRIGSGAAVPTSGRLHVENEIMAGTANTPREKIDVDGHIILTNGDRYVYAYTQGDYGYNIIVQGGWGGCFAEDTQIKTPAGYTLIKDLQVDDTVVSYDTDTSTLTETTVTGVFFRKVPSHFIINNTIHVTGEHPIYTKRGWIEVECITLEDELFDGTNWITVTTKEKNDIPIQVYNITVDSPNTYFAGGILAHNKDTTPRPGGDFFAVGGYGGQGGAPGDTQLGYDGTNKIGTVIFSNSFAFPTTDGTSGQVLKTDGAGTVSWATDIAGLWTQTSGVLHPTTSTDSVGIATGESINFDYGVGTKTLLYSTPNTRFEFNDDVDISGDLEFVGGTSTASFTISGGDFFIESDQAITMDTAQTKYLYWTAGNARFEFNDDLYVAGTGEFTGALTVGAYTLPNTDGTVNQVLETDGAGTLSWVSAGGASPLTTKGDLYTYDTADARLPVGTNDYVLTADSLQSTGLKWAAIPAAPVTSVFGRTGVVVAAANDYTWAQIDKTTSDIADITTKSHTSLTSIGTNTHAQIDTHIADGTIHFLESAIDHLNILNIGTNTHAQIDTHIASTANPHSVTANQIGADNIITEVNTNGTGTFDWVRINKTGSNLTDIATRQHSDLTNLTWATAGHTIAGDQVVDFNNGGVAKTIHYDTAATRFETNDDLYSSGSIDGANYLVAGTEIIDTTRNIADAEVGTHTIGTRVYTNFEGLTADIGDATNYSSFASDGDLTLFGTARVKKLVQFFPYNMGAIAGTYNGISCAASGLGSLNGMYFKTFDDGGGAGQAECTNVQINLPEDYVDGTDVEIHFDWTTGGTSGVVRWQAGLNNVATGSTYSPSTYTWGTPQNITVPGTAWEKDEATFTISGTGIVKGDDIGVVVFRDADNAADTYTADSYIFLVKIVYTSDRIGG